MIQRTESESRNPNASTNEMGELTVDSSRSRRKKSRRDRGSQRKQRRRLLMEGLENRQLLASMGSVGSTESPVDTALFEATNPRNIGTITAFVYNESETAGTSGCERLAIFSRACSVGNRAR